MSMVVALALVASANANDETTLRAEDHGVLGAMYRVHCRPQWLSVVLRESNILESQLTTLRPGTPIVIPDGCQNGIPAREDVRMTAKIFAASERLREEENVKQENDALRQNVSQFTRQNEVLTTQNQVLKGELSAAKKIAAQEQSFETQRWMISGIMGFLVASAGWFVVVVIYRRRKQDGASEIDTQEEIHPPASIQPIMRELSPPKDDRPLRISDDVPSLAHPYEPKLCFSIMFHGKRVDFADTSTRFAGCPLCHEKRLMPNAANLRQHLEHVHIHLRLEERPADELRHRIALAQQQSARQ